MFKDDITSEYRAGVLPVDEATGLSVCPPPREIISIRVDRIYNECKQSDVIQLPIGINPTVKASEAQCVSAIAENVDCTVEDGIATVTFDLDITFNLLKKGRVVATITEKLFNQSKSVQLERAGEQGLNCEADIYPECLMCFVSNESSPGYVSEVTCCIGRMFLFRLVAPVQVLVPSFGFCPEPPNCGTVAGVCPDYNPPWPPYPPFPPTEPCGDKGHHHGGCGCDNLSTHGAEEEDEEE